MLILYPCPVCSKPIFISNRPQDPKDDTPPAEAFRTLGRVAYYTADSLIRRAIVAGDVEVTAVNRYIADWYEEAWGTAGFADLTVPWIMQRAIKDLRLTREAEGPMGLARSFYDGVREAAKMGCCAAFVHQAAEKLATPDMGALLT